MANRHEEWLKLTHEEPIDPEIPICDAHHHLWDYPDSLPENRIPSFSRQIPHYQLPQLLADISGGHNIVKTVFLECNSMYRKNGPTELRPIGETEYVIGAAAQSASGQYGNTAVAAGIIGFADLTLGDAVIPVLEAQLAAGRDRFRGIRYAVNWDASPEIASAVNRPGILLEQKFHQGFACLGRYNLSFDAMIYHTQMAECLELAKAFPDTIIILNHMGAPIGFGSYASKYDEVLLEWKRGLAAMAACPNVVVKLGGLGTLRAGLGWYARSEPPHSDELAKRMAPYFSWCIEHFGTDRCMFESNFPVDKASYSYTIVWNAFKRFAKDFSPREKAALFHDTAVKAYRLLEPVTN